MLNVFFISNDTRVEKLIAHFQPFFKTKIRRSTDFDQGLKEVFENRPSLVFIQSTIDAVSGETVARHIKSLLGSDSPKIVFMDETPGGGKKGTSWCDDSIVISDSAERFKEDFAALVSRHFPMDWREVHESADTKSSVKMGRNAEPVEEKHGAVPAPERREPLGTERFIAESKPSRKSAGDVADVAVTEDAPVERMHRQDTISDFSAVPVKRKRGRYFAFLGVVALLLGAWAYLYLFRNGTDNRHETGKIIAPIPVDRKTPPVPSANREEQRKIVDLPAWIPPATRDPSYREGHPGWERYLLPEYDVRVFREGPPIKALQVIARTEKGVSGAFLLSVLEGFGYKGPLPSGSERKKDNFLVRSVKLDGFGELVTYREEGASSLKAFILEFT